MSSHNPLMPQGSIDEPKPKNKSNIYIAVFAILAFHVVLLGALLLQGCKGNPPGGNLANNKDTSLPPIDTGLLPPTNPAPMDVGMANPFAPPLDVGSSNPAVPPPAFPPLPGSNTTVPLAPELIAPPPPPSLGVREHEVAAGESFSSIGKKYGVSAAAIAKANPNVDSTKLRIKQKIKIPESAALAPAAPSLPGIGEALPSAPATTVTYTVKKGDNLTKIAKLHGTRVESLKAANNLKTTVIKEGQKLKIPAKAASAPVAPAAPPAAPLPPTSNSYVTPLPGGSAPAF